MEVRRRKKAGKVRVNGKATVRSLYTDDIQFAVNNTTNIERLPWKRNNAFYLLLSYICCCQHETCLGLHVNARYFLSHFNQFWVYSTGIHKSRQYQISRKSVQQKPRWHMPTGGQTWNQYAVFATTQQRLKRTTGQCHSSCQITECFYRWLATLDHECKISLVKMSGKILFFRPPVQTGFGAHNVYRISLLGLAVGHPPLSSAEVIPLIVHNFSAYGGTTSSRLTCSEHWTDVTLKCGNTRPSRTSSTARFG
jgi:hypothetical protein